jgi:hypothetical protein
MTTYEHPLLADLVRNVGRPCLSLYVPTHRTQPERRDDLTKYRVLTKQLEDSLRTSYDDDEVSKLMRPFKSLLDDDDFWNQRKEGIAVFAAPGFSTAYHLERPVPELAIAASSFHLKPLLRIIQTLDTYHVLSINREQIGLYIGDRDGLKEVELHASVPRTVEDALGELVTEKHQTIASSGGAPHVHGHSTIQDENEKDMERFFRAVDSAIMEHYSRPTGLPVILAGLPEQLAVFHRVRKNPNILLEGVTAHPGGMSRDELSDRAWKIIQPMKTAESQRQIERFKEALAAGKASSDPIEIAREAAAGRVAVLMVEADRQIPGSVDAETGEVRFDDLQQPDVDDLLDDVAELVLKKKGSVSVLEAEHMPTTTGIAAHYRY